MTGTLLVLNAQPSLGMFLASSFYLSLYLPFATGFITFLLYILPSLLLCVWLAFAWLLALDVTLLLSFF